MVSRRAFLSITAAAIAAPRLAWAQSSAAGKVALYANVGAELTRYEVDVAGRTLTKSESVTLPAACNMPGRMPRGAISMSRPATARRVRPAGTEHHVTAFAIDPTTGALKKHGEPIRCRPARSI